MIGFGPGVVTVLGVVAKFEFSRLSPEQLIVAFGQIAVQFPQLLQKFFRYCLSSSHNVKEYAGVKLPITPIYFDLSQFKTVSEL